ncbi:hypothetical protein CCHL11_02277 [Colletotrichum chlorophyti]|uniref:Uncharacterized protein n=1 Tax=Colletotrichum chlorophyti TaxID=708187 RepID=A0A1Q8S5K7_9PEZI|nr:hypothetical protein CCHL11_02277 [Colletotrichum chlorophyti]
MCHGHPRWHPCSHTSINWHYCPSALIDLETGVETPCTHLSYAIAQPSNSDCPLLNCQFKAMGGTWTCCQCGQGPNTYGWCTMTMPKPSQHLDGHVTEELETCDHGCCAECERYLSARKTMPDLTFSDLRKGTASRKFGYSSAVRSHRRGPALSDLSGFAPAGEEDEFGSPSTYGSSSKSRVSYNAPVSNSASYNSATSSSCGSSYSVNLEYSSKRQKISSGKRSKKVIR